MRRHIAFWKSEKARKRQTRTVLGAMWALVAAVLAGPVVLSSTSCKPVVRDAAATAESEALKAAAEAEYKVVHITVQTGGASHSNVYYTDGYETVPGGGIKFTCKADGRSVLLYGGVITVTGRGPRE